jgi:PAS domain S-box-containing protein
MAIASPDSAADLTASQILAPQNWAPRSPRPQWGLDVTCTKIAVDFQNMTRKAMDGIIAENLELLRESVACDVAFVALLNEAGASIETVHCAKGPFAQCRPEALQGESLAEWTWLATRLEHLRLSEVLDSTAPRKEQLAEARRLAQLHICSVLWVAFHIAGRPAGLLGLAHALPRGAWDVNQQLLLKLLGTSLASGLERLSLEAKLEKHEQRAELVRDTSNDGLWDFDVEHNETYFSPRWKQMLGYREDDPTDKPDWRSLVHPEDMTRVQTAIRDHVAGKTPLFESTHRMRHRNGEWRWVISRARAKVDEHGRLLRLVGVELDITERKLYEDALFREKESAQITLQSIGDGDRLHQPRCRAAHRLATRGCDGAARRRGVPRVPRRDLRAARESADAVGAARAPDQVGAADAADPQGRQRALRREHRGADPRRHRPGRWRSARVPRRQREPRAQSQAFLPCQPRHPHGTREPA